MKRQTVGQVLADAVLTVVHAVRHLHEVNQTSVTSGQTLSCERSPPTAWPKGEEMLSAIRRVGVHCDCVACTQDLLKVNLLTCFQLMIQELPVCHIFLCKAGYS